MAGWIDDLFGPDNQSAGTTNQPRRGKWNLSSKFIVTDNPATGAKDIDIDGASVGTSLGVTIAISQGNYIP
jgi:hypothetical protein